MAEKLTFESGMAELEQIVRDLENGTVSLDESFKSYQKGVKLYKKLKAILDEGDAKIRVLTEESESELSEDTLNENR